MERQGQPSDESERNYNMKMWDGRFSKPSDRLMEEFNNSLPVDKKLIAEDIRGSIAWVGVLLKIGVYSENEYQTVIKGLRKILDEYKNGSVTFAPDDEDIHMAVERLLIDRVGEAGARLHTGRSRNDQVVTDTRLYAKGALARVRDALRGLQKSLVNRAETDRGVIMPGYTHLQQAQPVYLSHYWMSMFHLLERDIRRVDSAIASADMLPLGAGALAGSGFDVDRAQLARDLDFGAVMPNSIDAVASRDFVLDALSAAVSIAINCSRYAEDLIIWSSREFSFVELDDAWSTGSSMMPQKKNPDPLELIRGKCGRFIGNYTRSATTFKGVGLTYYKDLQEDKEPLFDSMEQINLVIAVMAQVIATLKVKKARISEDLDSMLFATDVADYLVRKKLPFRQAHKVVGKLVAHCIEKRKQLNEVALEDLKRFSELFDTDVREIFSGAHPWTVVPYPVGPVQRVSMSRSKAQKRCLRGRRSIKMRCGVFLLLFVVSIAAKPVHVLYLDDVFAEAEGWPDREANAVLSAVQQVVKHVVVHEVSGYAHPKVLGSIEIDAAAEAVEQHCVRLLHAAA